MKAYVYLFEDYIEFIFALGHELERRYPRQLEIVGLAARRRTICKKIDESGLPIKSYDYLGDLECEWLARPLDKTKLDKYTNLLGTEKLRLIINCDRELAHGFIRGGTFARTPLREMVEENEELRWRYLVGVLDYFFYVFEKEKPDFIFFSEFTMAYEVAAQIVAEHLKIPCITGFISRFLNLYFVSPSLKRRYPAVEKLYSESLLNQNCLSRESIGKASQYLLEFRNRPQLPAYCADLAVKAQRKTKITEVVKGLAYDCVKWVAIILGLKGSKGYIRQRNGWDLLVTNWRANKVTRAALNFKVFENAEKYLGEPFYYYPLHVEPEASTLVDANVFSNQLLIIEQIAKAMPLGSRLLVKEHVPMVGRRPAGFYESIKAIPDVHLVSPFNDSFTLLKRCRALITITGTAGWEALLLKRPLVVIGETEYNFLGEGIVRADSLVAMSKYLALAEAQVPIEDLKLILFIAACLENGVHLPVQVFAYAHYGQDGKKVIAENAAAVSQVADRVLEYARPMEVQ